MRYHLTATIQSRNKSLSTSSQATREGVGARPSVACHYPAWKYGGGSCGVAEHPRSVPWDGGVWEEDFPWKLHEKH